MNDDWFDLLQSLSAAGVRYLVVGAHALAVHGVPRATEDIDVWTDPSPRNAERTWQALADFGAPLDAMHVTVQDLTTPGVVVQLGLPPNRADILTGISGLSSFDEAWASRVEQLVRGHLVPFLGREALIRNKRASARHKDLGDLEALGERP